MGLENTFLAWLTSNQEALLGYLVNIVSALLILAAGMMIARLVTRYSQELMSRRDIDPTTTGFLSMIVRYGIIIFAVVIALGNLGVKTAPLITMLGAAGIAVGLALQSSLSNFAAGLIMVIFRPVKVGDYVEVSGKSGTIMAISIISTSLKEANGYLHTIPNNAMINSAVSNLTGNETRRTDLVIGVGYDSDIKQVKAILNDIVKNQVGILPQESFSIELDDLAASSINFLIRYWTNVPDVLSTRWSILEQVKNRLDEAGIEIPYQTMSVHLQNTPEQIKKTH